MITIRHAWLQKHGSPAASQGEFHWYPPEGDRELRLRLVERSRGVEPPAALWELAPGRVAWAQAFAATAPSDARRYLGLVVTIAEDPTATTRQLLEALELPPAAPWDEATVPRTAAADDGLGEAAPTARHAAIARDDAKRRVAVDDAGRRVTENDARGRRAAVDDARLDAAGRRVTADDARGLRTAAGNAGRRGPTVDPNGRRSAVAVDLDGGAAREGASTDEVGRGGGAGPLDDSKRDSGAGSLDDAAFSSDAVWRERWRHAEDAPASPALAALGEHELVRIARMLLVGGDTVVTDLTSGELPRRLASLERWMPEAVLAKTRCGALRAGVAPPTTDPVAALAVAASHEPASREARAWTLLAELATAQGRTVDEVHADAQRAEAPVLAGPERAAVGDARDLVRVLHLWGRGRLDGVAGAETRADRLADAVALRVLAAWLGERDPGAVIAGARGHALLPAAQRALLLDTVARRTASLRSLVEGDHA